MKRNSYPGKFIVFEGLDGSGQSTEVRLLTDFLKEKGYRILKTKEPTKKSEKAKLIESVLEKKEKLSPRELQDLFSQDRKWHLNNIIIPALKDGKIVISDRYFFSSFSYGMAEGLSLEELIELNNQFLLPDLVFFLDVKPKICMERVEKRGEEKTLFEKEEKLRKVYGNYKIVFNRFKELTEIYFIKGERSIEEVFGDIKKIIYEKF